MKELWTKAKQLALDIWEYLQGLKTIIYMMAVAAVGAAQEVGVDKFVPEEHVGKALLIVAFGGIFLRFITTGPIKGIR